MKCYLRKNYNYDYVHYTGDNFEELKELADPVKVSQTETGAVIHLIEYGHYNLCLEIGDYIVKKSYKEDISFEIFKEEEFYDMFNPSLEANENILTIDRERGFIKRRPTQEEIDEFWYTERDEKNIPIYDLGPWAIIEYRDHKIPVYNDDQGQQDFIIFNDEEFGGGSYNFMADYDFVDFVDKQLENMYED